MQGACGAWLPSPLKLVIWSSRMEVIGLMPVTNRNWLCLMALIVMNANRIVNPQWNSTVESMADD